MKNKVVKHLKDDMEMFKNEASEDKKLIKSLKKKKKKSAKTVKVKRWQSK